MPREVQGAHRALGTGVGGWLVQSHEGLVGDLDSGLPEDGTNSS